MASSPRDLKPRLWSRKGVSWSAQVDYINGCPVEEIDSIIFGNYTLTVGDVIHRPEGPFTFDGIYGTETVQWAERISWTVHDSDTDKRVRHVAIKGTCQSCGAETVDNPKQCNACKLDDRRRWNRINARKSRRRTGKVTTPAVIFCRHCGKAFEPQRSTAKYCSSHCRVTAHRQRTK